MIDKLNSIVDSFPQKPVLVVGDVMVDEYIWGGVSRVSPEAPVPIVRENKRERRPGGALNVVCNLLSLKASPLVTGVVGKDDVSHYIKKYLKQNGIDDSGIIDVPSRPTTLKTRIIGNSQQIVRLDAENSDIIDNTVTDKILTYIEKKSDDISGIIISDYNKGLINGKILQKVNDLRNDKGIFVAVDPEIRHYRYYKDVSLITPNHKEAGSFVGIRIEDDKSLHDTANRILKEINPELLLITLGEDGMMLCNNDGKVTHVPTIAKHVYDVTGAGDTVISVFTLAMICGATPHESAVLSNAAAGYVVGEAGTTAIPFDVLKSRITKEFISS